jgi:FkbM family methyltransferase
VILAAVVLGLLAAAGCSEEDGSRIQRLRILEDRPRKMELGYGNLDMASNGESRVVRTLIDPGDIVFDVGANVGSWSLHVLEHQPTARVHAFEPTPDVFAELETNLAGSGGVAVGAALSDEAGVMEFYVYPGASILNGFYDRMPDFEGAVVIDVPTLRLDEYCAERQIEGIDYLKIDTEGAELLVLRGATGLLQQQSIRLIQFEYGGAYRDAGITLKEIFELLSSFGYEQYRIVRYGLLQVDGWHDSLENYKFANYLAVAP